MKLRRVRRDTASNTTRRDAPARWSPAEGPDFSDTLSARPPPCTARSSSSIGCPAPPGCQTPTSARLPDPHFSLKSASLAQPPPDVKPAVVPVILAQRSKLLPPPGHLVRSARTSRRIPSSSAAVVRAEQFPREQNYCRAMPTMQRSSLRSTRFFFDESAPVEAALEERAEDDAVMMAPASLARPMAKA